MLRGATMRPENPTDLFFAEDCAGRIVLVCDDATPFGYPKFEDGIGGSKNPGQYNRLKLQ